MRIRHAATALALATAVTVGVTALPATATPAATTATGSAAVSPATPVTVAPERPTVQELLARLPNGVIAGASVRHDGVGAAALTD